MVITRLAINSRKWFHVIGNGLEALRSPSPDLQGAPKVPPVTKVPPMGPRGGTAGHRHQRNYDVTGRKLNTTWVDFCLFFRILLEGIPKLIIFVDLNGVCGVIRVADQTHTHERCKIAYSVRILHTHVFNRLGPNLTRLKVQTRWLIVLLYRYPVVRDISSTIPRI